MIVHQLVERASRAAQGAQASLVQRESTGVSFDNDKLKVAQSSHDAEVHVKVIADGRVGMSHTTDVHDLDGVVARAVECARFGGPAHFRFPGPQEGTEVKVYDERVPPVTKREMIEIGQEMVELIKRYDPEIRVAAEISKTVTRTAFANASGAEFTGASTDFRVSVYGWLVGDTGILSLGHRLWGKHRAIDHVTIAEQVIEWFRMAERVVPIRSGRMPVILAPVGMGFLGVLLALGLNGRDVLSGSSPLAGKLGKRVADQGLTLIDNPLIDYAANSGKYDAEGMPHRITPLIEEGVVRNFFYDLNTAGQAGTQSTGHGPDRLPTNLLIREGDAPYEEMVKGVREGLLVLGVIGLGEGNPWSGAFSANVQLGFKIENGEVVGRVKDIMLTGNAYDALKDVEAIGDKAEWLTAFGGPYWFPLILSTPPVQIGSLSVAAR